MSRSTGWLQPEHVVLLGGVSAALHVGKLSPALPVLRAALDVSLLQAGFLLSMVQFAGMLLGLALGLGADSIGLRRSMLAGLLLLSAAGALGGWAQDAATLLVLRALEGVGFLLVVLPAPGLIVRLADPARRHVAMGLWGAFMPMGTALALFAGPAVVAGMGWPAWWWMLAALSLGAAACLWLGLAPDPAPAPVPLPGPVGAKSGQPADGAWTARLRRTLRAPGPWLVALAFAVYAAQWLAVIGFLPSVFAGQEGAGGLPGAALALVAAVNMVGNIVSGRLLQRGVAAHRLLIAGFSAMAVGAFLAFAAVPGVHGEGLPVAVRYLGLLLFSMLGGMVPGTLFALAPALAPDAGCVSTTVGWMQQCSSFGQFVGPPIVGWVAGLAGGWRWTWMVTGSCALVGVLLALRIAGVPRR